MSKPEVKTTTTVDILQVLHYMEFNGHKGIYSRVLNHIRDRRINGLSNDCYVEGYCLDPDECYDPELIQYLNLIKEEFGPIHEGLIKICW